MSATEKKSLIDRVKSYFRESKSEFKKIVWPSKKQIINNSIVVLVGIVACALFVSAIDFVFTEGFRAIINLF